MRLRIALTFGLLASLILVDAAAAYYSPSTGRFLNRDPVDEPSAVLLRTGRQASKFIPRDKLSNDGKNLYGFVVNSPVNQIDPVGLCTALGPLIQYRTSLAASDAYRVGTPHQDLADQMVATINQTFKDFNIVVPKRTQSGPFKQGNTPYQAGGIQFQANDMVLGSFMVFMVFEICEACNGSA